jgi:hypothetical protein
MFVTTDRYHGVITQKHLISINAREKQNFEMLYMEWISIVSTKISEMEQH